MVVVVVSGSILFLFRDLGAPFLRLWRFMMFDHVFNHFAGNLWACQLPGLYNAQVQQNTAPMIRPHAPRGALLDTDTETQIDSYVKDVWVTMGGQWNSIPHKVPWQ